MLFASYPESVRKNHVLLFLNVILQRDFGLSRCSIGLTLLVISIARVVMSGHYRNLSCLRHMLPIS